MGMYVNNDGVYILPLGKQKGNDEGAPQEAGGDVGDKPLEAGPQEVGDKPLEAGPQDTVEVGGNPATPQTPTQDILGSGQGDSVTVNVSVSILGREGAEVLSEQGPLVTQSSSGLQRRWAAFVAEKCLSGNIDVNALVQQVLRSSYLETTEDLRFYAEKVKYYNDLKDNLRQLLTDNRTFISGLVTEAANQGIDLEDTGNPDTVAFFSEYAQEHGTEAMGRLFGGIDGLASELSVDALVANADNLAQEKFGVGLPQAIQDKLRTAFAGDDPQLQKEALEEVAMFFCYLGDGGVQDGVWGEGGYDDIAHVGDEAPVLVGGDVDEDAIMADFAYYRDDDANKEARSNLAEGDIKIITAAFGLKKGTLSGNSSMAKIVEAAFQPVNDKWKNQILHGKFEATVDLNQEIAEQGPDGELAQEILGDDADSYWYASGSDDFSRFMLDAGLSTQIPPPGVTTKEGLEANIENLETQLNSVGDDAQLANVDLQNVLQKQQQTLQMMSNISKMLHDTAMSVIRKLGG